MASFSELSADNYYLIQETEHSRIELVYVLMITGKCVLIEFQGEDQATAWHKKSDFIFEIVEQLTEEQAVMFESVVNQDDKEEDDTEWQVDDDINTWFGDEDDNDEKMRALNN